MDLLVVLAYGAELWVIMLLSYHTVHRQPPRCFSDMQHSSRG